MIPGLLAAIAVFSYLLGGLNGAIIASKYVFHRDVRDYGSGNAGLTNFFRTFGAPGLAIVIGTDVLKTVIAVVAGGLIMGTQGAASTGQVFAGFCVMLGHIYPVFYGFRGGKGVASSYSIAIFTFPLGALGAILIGGLILLINKKMSIMSLTAMLLFFLATVVFQLANLPLVILAGLLTIVVFVRHTDNIKRLIHGEEQRLRKEGL